MGRQKKRMTMTPHHLTYVLLASAVLLHETAQAQMQFEIPAEMLGQMFGGGGGQRQQQQRQPKTTNWPKWAKTEIAPEFQWLVNTEWAGKTSKYSLLRDGIIESSLKECKPEQACKWAANNGKLFFNTPTLGVVEFDSEGSKAFGGDEAAAHRLQEHVLDELKKVSFIGVKANKSGKKTKLDFSKVVADENEDAMIAEDLYTLLGVTPEIETKKIKSSYRRLSVKVHPDKCAPSDKEMCQKKFDELRQAFEIISDEAKREYYNVGGISLVRNMENSWREVEGQQAQQMAQLDQQLQQVPNHHPQRAQFEAQVNAQKRQLENQLDRGRLKPELEQKMRNDDIEQDVPLSLEQLYTGTASHSFTHNKLVICRGCRADPTKEACKGCGRCPAEKRQEPKYANTIFGRQVVGMKDNLGHQTPGKLPGRVKLKLSVAEHETMTMTSDNLFTVMKLTLAESLFGFRKSFDGLDGKKILIARKSAHDGLVLKVHKKGMFNPKSRQPYGDLYVRIKIELPNVSGGSLTVSAPDAAGEEDASLSRETNVELRDGAQIWRRWVGAEESQDAKSDGSLPKDEL